MAALAEVVRERGGLRTAGQDVGPQDGGEVREVRAREGGGVDAFRGVVPEARRRGGEAQVIGRFARWGNDEGAHRPRRSVGKERDVIARVAVAGQGKPAVASLFPGGDGHPFLETKRLAGEREGFGGARSLEVGGERHAGCPAAIAAAGHFHVQQGLVSGAAAGEDADGVVRRGGSGEGKHAHGRFLRQRFEAGARGRPSFVLGRPVAGLEVRGKPDFRASGQPGEVFDSLVEQGREIRGAVGGRGGGKVREVVHRWHFLWCPAGAVDEDQPRAAEAVLRVAHFFEHDAAAGLQSVTRFYLHRGRAVEQEHHGIDGSASPAEQAGDDRSGGGECKCRDAKGAAGEDEDVAEFLAPARFAGRLEKELHGRPLDRLVAALVDQVHDDRHRGGGQKPEQGWRKKAHGCQCFDLGRRAVRNSRSNGSSGVSVVTSW